MGRQQRVFSFAIAVAAVLSTGPCHAQTLSPALISSVVSDLATSATHSWELGTRTQAVLDLNVTPYSVLTPNTHLPPPASVPPNLKSALAPVLSVAHNVVANRSNSNGGITGPQPLINDGAAGDPASIGMSVLLANWTGAGKSDGLNYAGAATDQLNFLLQKVPHTSDGAISHRVSQLQLWSDSVYMVPPFLAYYGMITNNQTTLSSAYRQIQLYRNYLLDPNGSGLWQHIKLGQGTDPGHWATGNGWAAAGMLRVLGTIQNSRYAGALQSEMNDLTNWVLEIQKGMYNNIDSTSLFKNYPDQPLSAASGSSGGNFYDSSSTALIASTVYRLSLLSGVNTYLPQAEKSRNALYASNGSVHFTSSGLVKPVVDPLDWSQQLSVPSQGSSGGSPEGEAFVLEMQSAWRDWVAAGSNGLNDT